jgi:hypothetical protein
MLLASISLLRRNDDTNSDPARRRRDILNPCADRESGEMPKSTFSAESQEMDGVPKDAPRGH